MIKNFILTGLMALSGIFVTAQPAAKSLIIGGDITVSSEQQKIVNRDQKLQYTRFRIMPKVGYFLSDHMAIGIQAGVSCLGRKLDQEGDYAKLHENILLFSPFVRYYLTSGKVGIFTEGSIDLGYGFIKQTGNDVTKKGNIAQISLGVSPGIYYEIHPKMTLEFSAGWLGYSYATRKIEGIKEMSSQLGFNFKTTGLSLGVTFKL